MSKKMPAMIIFFVVFGLAIVVGMAKDVKNPNNPKKENTPVVIKNFWATWCIPCMKEMPSLVDFSKKYPNVKILSYNEDDSKQAEAINKTKIKFGIDKTNIEVISDDMTVAHQFKVTAIPVTLIMKGETIIKRYDGEVDFQSESFLELLKN